MPLMGTAIVRSLLRRRWVDRKTVSAALLLGLALASAASLPALASTRLDDGAVVIRASGATSDGIGAGTIVAVDGTTVRILTAEHVASFGTLTVRFPSGATAAARVVDAVAGRDLAIVEARVPGDLAATLHAAPIAEATSQSAVHVWGSGLNGPAFEPGATQRVGAQLPDGAARGRFALDCALCHEGDSGGGVFDDRGRLVGVYIGYFGDAATPRVSVAESTDASVVKIARSNTSLTPVKSVASIEIPLAKARRNAASTTSESAIASDPGRSSTMVLADVRPTR